MSLAGEENHMNLAKMAVEETGRGIYEDKITKKMANYQALLRFYILIIMFLRFNLRLYKITNLVKITM